ncbi:MAG: DUF1501 domain-containing protein [Planctomycetales bacterium]|nr:DUF1501 domain-containing protein [Planctomycetales bacterium]
MLRFKTPERLLCDGLSRRDLMKVSGLSVLSGLTLPRPGQAADSNIPKPSGPAKSVILFNLLGGPSQLDMFDMKPAAPVEVRGEFKSIQTSLPGLQICEHMPNIARMMHKTALIRTVTHGYNSHNPLNIMTGWSLGNPAALSPDPNDPPDIGAVCQYVGMGPEDMPGAFCLPCYPGWGESGMYPGLRRPGPYGGHLGSQYDPLFALCDPTFDRKPDRPYYGTAIALGEPQMPSADALPDMTNQRLNYRRSMLTRIDKDFLQAFKSQSVEQLERFQDQAFSLLCGSKVRDAFDLSRESAELRQSYGRTLFGNSMLVARRLVEAGVPFISVHAENFLPNGSFTYDMHENNFAMLKEHNLPVLDTLLPALVDDLEQRGLLDSTLIYVMGEMGRSPKVNAKAGRDHWPQCGFCLMIGGGIKPGAEYGTTDAIAAYPASNPVSPADIVATIYQQLGIDPHTMLPDRTGRPISIAHGGQPIWDIIG